MVVSCWIMDALEVELAPEVVGEFAAAGCCEGGFPFGVREGRVDLAVVVRGVGARARGEVGELVEEDVELDGAAFDGDALDLIAPCRVDVVAEHG